MAKSKNVIEMIKGQKNSGREVVGVIVSNKVDGNKDYKITAFDAENAVITLEEVLPEGSEEMPKVIKVSEKNAQTVRYGYNPNEKPAPEAQIIDGALNINLAEESKTIQMGNIKAIKVLGGAPGVVLFIAESGDNSFSLMSYDVQFDKFETELDKINEGAALYNVDGRTFLVENNYSEVPVIDPATGKQEIASDGTPIVKLRFDGATIKEYHKGGGVSGNYSDEEYDEDEDEYYTTEYTVTRPIDSIRMIEYDKRKVLVIPSQSGIKINQTVDEAGEPVVMIADMSGRVYETVKVSDATNAKVYIGGTYRQPTLTVVTPKEFILKDAYGFKVVKDPAMLTELEGFTTFLGETTGKDEDENLVVYIAYANENYEVKSFKVVKTADRGDLYEMT